MTFQKYEPNVWHYEKTGDEIVGQVVKIEDNRMYDTKKVYELKKDDGASVLVFGTTVLDSKMRGIKIGNRVKIVYVGIKDSAVKGRNPTKLFEVFVDDGTSETIKVGAIAPASAPAAA
jgi:hypothetical protein